MPWLDDKMTALQIPASQPLLVLASCMRPTAELPPDLFSFFNGLSSDATATNPTTAAAVHSDSIPHPTVAKCQKVEAQQSKSSMTIALSAAQLPPSIWQEAAGRCAEAAAHHVAAAAAGQLQQRLLQQLQDTGSDADNAEMMGTVTDAGQSTRGRPCQQGQDAQGRPSQQEQELDMGANQQGQLAEAPGDTSGSGEGLQHKDSGKIPHMNANDLQKGLHLHAEVRCSEPCNMPRDNDSFLSMMHASHAGSAEPLYKHYISGANLGIPRLHVLYVFHKHMSLQ